MTPLEAQAKALDWMLKAASVRDDVAQMTASQVREANEPVSEYALMERILMKESRERSILESAVIEALYWLDCGASGKAHGVLALALDKLKAEREQR